MKKLAIYLTASLALLLASCSSGSDDSSSVTTIRVKGTAKAAPPSPSPSTSTRAAGQQFVIDSIDSFFVNGTDIKNQLVAPSGTTDGQSNVVFTAQVEVPEMTTIEAAARAGYIFDEWEVREEDGADEALLDEIDDWLDVGDREHSEELENVPKRYLPYLMAEYDYGFYVNFDVGTTAPEGSGTKDDPFNWLGLQAKLNADKDAGIKMDELSFVLGCSSSTPVIDVESFVSDLVTFLGSGTKLEELKLKIAPDNVTVSFPNVSNLEELKLSKFKFTDAVTIDNATTEYQFENCEFNDLTVTKAKEIEIKGGTAANITISNVKDVEIKGGKVATLKVVVADEVELESMEITDALDLSAMTSGEVELKNVAVPMEKITDPHNRITRK